MRIQHFVQNHGAMFRGVVCSVALALRRRRGGILGGHSNWLCCSFILRLWYNRIPPWTRTVSEAGLADAMGR